MIKTQQKILLNFSLLWISPMSSCSFPHIYYMPFCLCSWCDPLWLSWMLPWQHGTHWGFIWPHGGKWLCVLGCSTNGKSLSSTLLWSCRPEHLWSTLSLGLSPLHQRRRMRPLVAKPLWFYCWRRLLQVRRFGVFFTSFKKNLISRNRSLDPFKRFPDQAQEVTSVKRPKSIDITST